MIITTLPIPAYTATEDALEAIRRESGAPYGLSYTEARRNLQQADPDSRREEIPAGEFVPGWSFL